MAKLFLFITFCIFQLYCLCSNIPIMHAYHLCPLDQSLSLLKFKDSLQIDTSNVSNYYCEDYEYEYDSNYYCDDNNNPIIEPKISSWNSSTDCCSWEGVTCDKFTGEIIELDLSSSRLTGVIHSNSSIFQLSHLKRLNLAYNFLAGSKISPQFRRLTHLSHLNLTSSWFEESIKWNASSWLEKLELAYMHLPVKLLDNIWKLNHLTYLDLSDCELIDGTLPQSFGNLTHLSHLDLSWNDFSGPIPVEILGLEHLTSLVLRGNNLHTSIPHFSSNNMKMLKDLVLSDNQLNSNSVSSILCNLTQLEALDLLLNYSN